MNRASEDRAILNAILDVVVDVVIVSDQNGMILQANAAVTEMFGYDTSRLIAQNVSILIPSATASLHHGFMHHYIETSEKRIIGISRDLEGQRRH